MHTYITVYIALNDVWVHVGVNIPDPYCIITGASNKRSWWQTFFVFVI